MITMSFSPSVLAARLREVAEIIITIYQNIEWDNQGLEWDCHSILPTTAVAEDVAMTLVQDDTTRREEEGKATYF